MGGVASSNLRDSAVRQSLTALCGGRAALVQGLVHRKCRVVSALGGRAPLFDGWGGGKLARDVRKNS
jgi:hypothetical protein